MLDFYFDVVCPYAYMAALGGIFKSIEAPQIPAETWSAQRQALIAQDLRWQAQRHGIELRPPPEHPRRTVEAMRLVIGAPEARRRPLALALWKAYWEDLEDVTDRAVLGRIAGEQGVDPSVIDLPETRQALLEATAEAVDRGVFGVPTVHTGERIYWGQDRLQHLERELSQVRVEFFHDPSSPFAYLGSTQVQRLANRYGFELVPRPILLGGLFRDIGTPDVPMLAMSPSKQRYVAQDLADQAGRLGVPFHFPSTFPLRTVLPLRVLIQEPRATNPIYEAAWVRDRDIGQVPVVVQVLQEAGLDAEALVRGCQDPQVKARLKDNTQLAARAGVCGVPTFRVHAPDLEQPLLIWGVDRLELVEDVLAGWRPGP